MQPTPEQHLAITTQGRALFVEAGAGTGKTRVLVERFLFLLEQHPQWPLESLVAVTFTEKAAREMRTRIRTAVEERAAGATAGPSWLRRRLELEQLRVSTIHSLCARILRENAIAAGIDPRFDVLDEQEADLLKEEAVRQALADLVETDNPALELLASLQVNDVRRELLALLAQRGSVEQLFEGLPLPEQLLDAWRQGLAQMQESLWQQKLASDPLLARALAEVPQAACTNPADKLLPIVQEAREGCLLASRGDLAAAGARFRAIKVNVGSAASWGDKQALADLKELLKSLREAGKVLEQAGQVGPDDQEAAEALQHWRSLWRQAVTAYDRLKDQRQALDFDDLEMRAQALLEQSPRDRRLQAFVDGIHHLMVDEFQDTNQRQQRIVYALAAPADGDRLFVVGDAKQSIYRFRQAQVDVFNRTGQEIAAVTGHLALALSTSFRTHSRLLDVLNHTFNRILRPLGQDFQDFEARPGPLEANRASPSPHPDAPHPVELIILPRRDSADQTIPAEEARRWEAQLLAQRLHRLHASQFPIWDKYPGHYRPFEYGDAALLLRATTDLPLIEEVFKAAGLPYLTVGGRGFYYLPEVQDLVALLAALYNPRDDLNLATALRSPLFSLSDETLYRLRWRTPQNQQAPNPRPFVQALADPPPTDQPDQVTLAGQAIEELLGLAGRVEVWELLRSALDRTAYEVTLALSDGLNAGGGRQLANVRKLMELARSRSGASLSDFLRRVHDLRAREAREGEAPGAVVQSGRVQLMSVHAAKGLEFSVVALADLGRKKGGARGSPYLLCDPVYGLACKRRDENGDWQTPASYRWAQWQESRLEEAESRRLLYVACTRAADLLILSGQDGQGQSWLNDLAAAWEIALQGDAEESVPIDGIPILVQRPSSPPADMWPRKQRHPVAEAQAMVALPPLAGNLPAVSAYHDLPVTQLNQELKLDVAGLPPVRAAVPPAGHEQLPARAPGHLVGNLVHRVLAEWQPLLLSQARLAQRVRAGAHREGILDPHAVNHAVARSLHMLNGLRRTALFQEIEDATRRISEVPFSLAAGDRRLHGVIDLLFQDHHGTWYLVDWKTERTARDQLEEQVQAHLPQLAVYTMAVERLLGTRPYAYLCFLSLGAATRRFAPAELTPIWEQFIASQVHP